MLTIWGNASITGIIAVGLTFVILTAEIDLSVAAIANAIGITMAFFTAQPDYVNIAHIPLPHYQRILFMVVAHIVLTYTRFGRYVYMVGGNREAAEYSGVNIRGLNLQIALVFNVYAQKLKESAGQSALQKVRSGFWNEMRVDRKKSNRRDWFKSEAGRIIAAPPRYSRHPPSSHAPWSARTGPA